jgi:hypothetical protein
MPIRKKERFFILYIDYSCIYYNSICLRLRVILSDCPYQIPPTFRIILETVTDADRTTEQTYDCIRFKGTSEDPQFECQRDRQVAPLFVLTPDDNYSQYFYYSYTEFVEDCYEFMEQARLSSDERRWFAILLGQRANVRIPGHWNNFTTPFTRLIEKPGTKYNDLDFNDPIVRELCKAIGIDADNFLASPEHLPLKPQRLIPKSPQSAQ